MKIKQNPNLLADEITYQTRKLVTLIELREQREIDRIIGAAGLYVGDTLDEQYQETLNNLDRLMDLESI